MTMYSDVASSLDIVDSNPDLVPVGSNKFSNLAIDEVVALAEAKSLNQIDFIFFRRFNDGRSSQVAAYVVDNTKRSLGEKELADVHKQVWRQGIAPLLYIAWETRVDVLTCARGPDFWVNEDTSYNPILVAEQISSKLSDFSLHRLADGTFWENPANKHLADYAKAAHQSLIQAIVDADIAIEGEKNPTLRRLLLLMVLIKYLEDREVFPNAGWFGRFRQGAKCFLDILEGGNPDEVNRFLNFLEEKFNGDIFSLESGGRKELTTKLLKNFADLVDKKTIQKQRYLWEQFSFKHLPVEVISFLYQRFVQGGHGAVYTPPFLASLLLNYAMPYNRITGNERVLDPAMGSGVFLVGAFRRLVNKWRSTHEWKKPNVVILKTILNNSIFGVELESNAVHLTAFSLSLALCDALQPDVIWNELKFDRLNNINLFEEDFFKLLLDNHKIISKGFDVVIGNPPFQSELSSSAKEINGLAKRVNAERPTLPDKQIAYLFLEQALIILRPSGCACLIQPHGLIYNNKTERFRNYLFQRYTINTVLDFTSIRNLYEADPKTVAVHASSINPQKNHKLNHLTFRRTQSVQERICFELDHYDCHCISQQTISRFPFVWRMNLLGGGRLTEISQRLSSMPTLSEYIYQQNWEYGEGFISGKRGKRVPASHLTGKQFLPTKAFTVEGIKEGMITKVEESCFVSPKNERLFTPPFILIKESEALPIVFWESGYLTYKHKIVGIAAPRSQKTKLQKLYNYLKNQHSLLRFACTLNGSQALVGKATAILKIDIDRIPYSNEVNELSFSFWEKILCEDVLEYMTAYIRLGQNSTLLQTRAEIYTLKKYSEIFLKMLGSVYENLHTHSPIFLHGLICQPFYFGKRQDVSWLKKITKDSLYNIIYDQKYEELRTVRVFRYYDKNFMLIVKPDRLRYWIRSTAIRDADETLQDLQGMGY